MKFEKTVVSSDMFLNALYGMRNPKNSWDKFDSKIVDGKIEIGPNDMELAQRLVRAGAADCKFLRQIPVSVQITAPAYWWPEMDQYKIGTVTDSTSKMHKLLSKPIDEDCFEDGIGDVFIDALECWRQQAIAEKDPANKKAIWKKLLAHLPHSWLQTRMWSANYAVLRNIYFQRKTHKLDQWRYDFCDWIKSLPYAEELIIYTGKEMEPCKTLDDILKREG